MRYLDGDTIAECHLAIRAGRSLDTLAGRLHCDSEYLGRLLQLPAQRNVPAADADQSCDLWRVDELRGQL